MEINTPETIPFTAWEQAVFVVLFVVLVALLLRWFTKQQKEWQEFTMRQNDSFAKTLKDQSNKFSVSISDQGNAFSQTLKDQNIQWQKWMHDQNDRECDTMDRVTEALNKLTIKLAEHDERSNNRFIEALEVAKAMNAPRRSDRSQTSTKGE